jgi:hypothetical protein
MRGKRGRIANMKKEKKPTTMKENLGKLLLDVGKLTFGSFIWEVFCVAKFRSISY